MQPTIWFNVPRGFDMLLPLMEADLKLAKRVFERLRVVFYAGAALPQATWERLQALATKVRGEEVWLTTSWGSTETAPGITSAHFKLDRAGVIGLPLPGIELKFLPSGSGPGQKLEQTGPDAPIFGTDVSLQKARMKAINAELATLGARFSKAVLAEVIAAVIRHLDGAPRLPAPRRCRS